MRCPDLALEPGGIAYWWMGPNRGLSLTTDFWRIPSDASGDIRHLARTAETRPFKQFQRGLWDAVISDTLQHAPGDDDGDAEPLRFTHNSTWIACLGGCCESARLEAVQ